ncbi:hypothetical protein CANARDRAFT_29591 [[Candida] arabinofermentans NRRL YB-2248]|uniref:Major facilitator superfamily (MFS) profile domain-containing protein n=1 Tax=[Candida] arabinofermentans NRRL YB-2248 TaxID=983967 RepID=A0A1E4SWI8_9ASCO|nr:hypothetical protein CANARDRAFT_29591 [[Candida] arabinofermentans NRRL YB-2248]
MVSQAKANKSAGDKISYILPEDDRKWYQRPNLIKLNIICGNFMLYAASIGYDSNLTSSIQALVQWKAFMGHPTGAWLGFINACPFIGAVVLILFVPYFCDRFGRKVIIFITSCFVWLGAIVASSAKNDASYIVGRILIGCSFATNYAANLYINEVAYPIHRGRFSAAYHSMFDLGAVLVSWVVFGTRSINSNVAWRIPLALQVALPVILLPILILSPESPRWLASKGKIEEAKEILMKYHANYEPEYIPLVELEMAEIINSLEIQKINNQNTWKCLFETPGNRKRVFIGSFTCLSSAWSGNAIVLNYFTTVLTQVGITAIWEQTLLNACVQMFAFLCALSGAFMVDKWGRRTLFLVSTIGLFCCYIGLATITAVFIETKKNIGQAIIVFVFLCRGVNDFAWTPLVTAYPAEIWPQETRSKGMFSAMFVLNSMYLVATFVNSIGMKNLTWKYYCVYLGFQVVIIGVIYFTFPETNGHSLEEIALIFDKDEATQHAFDSVQVDKRVTEEGKLEAIVSVTELSEHYMSPRTSLKV